MDLSRKQSLPRHGVVCLCGKIYIKRMLDVFRTDRRGFSSMSLMAHCSSSSSSGCEVKEYHSVFVYPLLKR